MATFVRVVELIGDERRRDAALNVDQIQSMRRLLPSDGEEPSTIVHFNSGFMLVAEYPDDIERLAAAAIAEAEGRTMAVEIAPVLGCATCESPLCRACLGCVSCRTVSAGCVCPSPEFTAERVAARRAWLAAGREVGAHLDDCFPCSLDWVPNCPEGMALRDAVDAAWERYEEMGR